MRGGVLFTQHVREIGSKTLLESQVLRLRSVHGGDSPPGPGLGPKKKRRRGVKGCVPNREVRKPSSLEHEPRKFPGGARKRNWKMGEHCMIGGRMSSEQGEPWLNVVAPLVKSRTLYPIIEKRAGPNSRSAKSRLTDSSMK